MSLSAVDFIVIALYFAAMIGIGVWSVIKTNTREDYLVAGRRLGFPLFFGCMAAMAVGGAVTVGGTGKGYQLGIAGAWVGGSLGMGLILLGMLVSSKLNRLRALSINEVIERNYGTTARIFGAILTIIYTVALTVVQVVSMGAIVEGIWPTLGPIYAMILSGAVVVFYTFLGGMWSVTMTDIVQFVVKTLGIMILVPVFVLRDKRIGGVSGFIDKVPSSHWNIGAMGGWGTLYWILLYVPGLVIGQDIWQRVFTARNDKIAKRGTLLAGLYSILYAFAAVMLGMSVFAAGIKLDRPELVFEAGVTHFLPMGAAGLLLAAALAASMSVASGTMLACSTVVYNDIYLRFIKKQSSGASADPGLSAMERHHAARSEAVEPASGKHDVWVNRAIAGTLRLAIIGLSVWITSLGGEPIFKALDLSYGFLSGAVFIPVFAAFILKKVSPRAGLCSLGASAVAIMVTMTYGETQGDLDFAIGGNWPIIIGMAIGLVTYTVITLADANKITPNTEIDEGAVGELPVEV
ncbi:sodium:solute symporter [Cutibacterium sp. WCA-380-WT-3A]|uniref:Sodium:solute symporter n=1 Tax=Cutibacterium porci TaxID=2605781 RepID=A0A7K0J6R4_9ACTN|nr:sodium:solute symporter [Cutibacterium porci]